MIQVAKKKNYLNNKDLYNEIVKSKEEGKLTRDAEKMLVLLAEREIRKLTYVNEDDINDCLQFALLDLLKYWQNFNPKYTNAFAYFTEIAKRGSSSSVAEKTQFLCSSRRFLGRNRLERSLQFGTLT